LKSPANALIMTDGMPVQHPPVLLAVPASWFQPRGSLDKLPNCDLFVRLAQCGRADGSPPHASFFRESFSIRDSQFSRCAAWRTRKCIVRTDLFRRGAPATGHPVRCTPMRRTKTYATRRGDAAVQAARRGVSPGGPNRATELLPAAARADATYRVQPTPRCERNEHYMAKRESDSQDATHATRACHRRDGFRRVAVRATRPDSLCQGMRRGSVGTGPLGKDGTNPLAFSHPSRPCGPRLTAAPQRLNRASSREGVYAPTRPLCGFPVTPAACTRPRRESLPRGQASDAWRR